MCGIYGIIFHDTPKVLSTKQCEQAKGLFTGLAMASVIRGRDASGMVRVENSGRHGLYKNNVPSLEIVHYARWNQQLEKIGVNTVGLLGHTRLGTHGLNTVENAHPFLFPTDEEGEALVGTHNGVLWDYRKYGRADLAVDSANLFYAMSLLAPSDWPVLLGEVSGSFALAWSHGSDVYLARNIGSPCILAYSDALNATIYASTQDIILTAVESVPYLSVQIKGQTKANKIYKYSPFNPKGAEEIGDFEDNLSKYSGYHDAWDNTFTTQQDYTSRVALPKPKEVLSESYECSVCLAPGVNVTFYEYTECWICDECAKHMQLPKEPSASRIETISDIYGQHEGRPGFNYLSNSIECGDCHMQYTLEALDELIYWDSGARIFICMDCVDMSYNQPKLELVP